MKKIAWQSAAIVALALFMARGDSRAQQLGKDAPPLAVAEFVKGKAVDLASGKGENVYVVEFWATWCVPCLDSIPHLTTLQKKFKDQGVTFIGVSNEEAEVVLPFVEKMGDKMDYTVAIDKNYGTTQGFMGAFGVETIPHAFIVDRTGKIVWHGHPLEGLEAALAKVVRKDYKFDPLKAEQLEKARKLIPVYGYLVDNVDEPGLQSEVAEMIQKYGEGDLQAMGSFGMIVLRGKAANDPVNQLALRGVKSAIDDGAANVPELLELYSKLLARTGDTARAEEVAKQADEARKSRAPVGTVSIDPAQSTK